MPFPGTTINGALVNLNPSPVQGFPQSSSALHLFATMKDRSMGDCAATLEAKMICRCTEVAELEAHEDVVLPAMSPAALVCKQS